MDQSCCLNAKEGLGICPASTSPSSYVARGLQDTPLVELGLLRRQE